MNFFTLVDHKALKGIAVFGDKLGSSDFPLATVALVDGQFPRASLSPFDNREHFSLDKSKPNYFIDSGYFFQATDEGFGGNKRKFMPIIIDDQPYFGNRSIVMLVLRKGQTIHHEHGTYPIWECNLPKETRKYNYLKLLGIERDQGWITIKQGRKKTSFHCYGYKFDVSEY